MAYSFGLLLILLYSSTRRFSFSFMTFVIFLFVLRIVNLNCWLPSRQDIVNCIAEGINYLKNHLDIIWNSFCVCGITTNDPGKVRNDEFLKNWRTNWQKDKLEDEEGEPFEDEDFFHVHNWLIIIIYNIMLRCINSTFSVSCSLVLFLI